MGMNPKDFQRVLRSWAGVNEFMKFSMEQKFADNLGISYEKLAQHRHAFIELTVPKGGLGNFGAEPGGLGDLSGMKADHRDSGYESLKQHGYSLENFGGSQGYSEAAKIAGIMEHIKGEKLSGEDISNARQAGILSESGLSQAISKAAKTLDMDPKVLNKALGSWEGVKEFMNFTETQKVADSAGMSLGKLSQYKQDFTEIGASVSSSGKPGSDQGGRYRVAFTPGGDVEFKGRQWGTESQVGDRGHYGHEKNIVDRTSRDSQDIDRAGVLISRGTIIDEKTAFQMALQGDENLVKPVTNQFHSDKEREAEIAVLSKSLAKGTADFMRREGVTADTFSASGGGSVRFRIFGTGMGGRAEVGFKKMDQQTVNLMTQEYGKLIRGVVNEAQEKGLNNRDARHLLSERIEDYTNKIYKSVKETNKWEYGASAPFKAAADVAKKYGETAVQNPNIPFYERK